jgi:hypothetical protein
MSDAEWDEAYRAAWANYYSAEHIRTILRRAAAHPAGRPKTAFSTLLWFKLVALFEGVHPLEGGAFRLKFRRDRRHGMPLENPAVFYPRYAAETVVKAWRYLAVYRAAMRTLREVLRASDRWTYTDLAITLPREDELDNLDLYRATSGGGAAVARVRREAEARARVALVSDGRPAEAR